MNAVHLTNQPAGHNVSFSLRMPEDARTYWLSHVEFFSKRSTFSNHHAYNSSPFSFF
jgi:hypothetical protein